MTLYNDIPIFGGSCHFSGPRSGGEARILSFENNDQNVLSDRNRIIVLIQPLRDDLSGSRSRVSADRDNKATKALLDLPPPRDFSGIYACHLSASDTQTLGLASDKGVCRESNGKCEFATKVCCGQGIVGNTHGIIGGGSSKVCRKEICYAAGGSNTGIASNGRFGSRQCTGILQNAKPKNDKNVGFTMQIVSLRIARTHLLWFASKYVRNRSQNTKKHDLNKRD